MPINVGKAPEPFDSIVMAFAVMSEPDDKRVGDPLAFFSTKDRAEEYAVGKGYYGGNAPIHILPLLKLNFSDRPVYYALASSIHVDYDLTNAKYDDEVRKRALRKLTPNERRVLGLASDVL